MRPHLDRLAEIDRRTAAARSRLERIQARKSTVDAALVNAEAQRVAAATEARQAAVVTVLADDGEPEAAADEVRLRELRVQVQAVEQKAAALRDVLEDLAGEQRKAEAAIASAEQERGAAMAEALTFYANAVALPAYMDAAQAYVRAARETFALEAIVSEATGVRTMLLGPGARRDCYVPNVAGASTEAIYKGPDFDGMTGNFRATVNAMRDRLASLGLIP